MKNTPMLRRILISLVFVVAVLSAWLPPAQADVIDKFADFLDQLGPANPFQSYGITGQSLRDSKGVITCLEKSSNNIDAANCIDTYSSTPVGQKLSKGIPSWFWDLLEAYIAFREKDFFYFVAKLGLAVACGVAHFFTAIDVCGLIQDLYEAAEALLDAGKAAAEFFKDLGEGTWEFAKGAYCASPLSVFGGCDDSGPPPKPKAQVIYETFFAPKVLPDGLAAIESETDLWAFDKLLTQLKAQAKAKGYSEGDILTAADIFSKAVDAQWTKDIVSNVLKELAVQRNSYNTSGRIYLAAADAWNRYKKDQKKLPYARVPSHCTDQFSTWGFSHVTRWTFAHSDKAKELNVQGIYQWCDKIFWEGNKTKFAEHFKGKSLMGSICPDLKCSSEADFEFCKPFMASVGLKCTTKLKPGNGPMMPMQPKGLLPDITSAAQIVIGSVPAQWGTTVNVDAKQAFSAQGGVCQFVVQHTARNIGLAATGGFDSLWKNSLVPSSWSRSWGSIAPGGQDTQKDLLSLKPGMNDLHLTLDNLSKVQESNEANNQFRVRVNVSGSCGAASRMGPPPSGAGNSPVSPGLPAVQQKSR